MHENNSEQPKTNYMENDLTAGSSEEFFPGTVVAHQLDGADAVFHCDNEVILLVRFLTDTMVRFRFTTEGEFPDDFSYAIDPAFTPNPPEITCREVEDRFELASGALTIKLTKSLLRITILNADGHVISDDEKGFHWEPNTHFGGNVVMTSKHLQAGEGFYGLGDKSCSLELRRKRFSIWGADTYGYGPDSDPLYKNIPFYIGLHHQISYGIFFDNSFRSFFDFGHERDNVTSFFAQGGEMNYYFIYGPSQREVAEGYAELTGRPSLPPIWALGYHQCKWSYESTETVKEIANKFRELEIPCDAIYLDIDYMDGFRCFTWHPDNFPNPKKLISELEEDGFKTVVMIDPGIKIDRDYWVYQEGKVGDHFCRRMDGDLMKGSVWPGLCCFPDYTKPEVRQWWAGLYREMIAELGVHGVWNDMNEPAVFEEGTFPRDVRHDYDGHPCSHRKGHNVYGMQMARATYEGLQRFGNGRRPFVITRSGYSGVQRFSSAWTGDNVASWDHLRIANIQCQRLSLTGLSFIGSDIGGFIGSPDGELFVRWLQMAIFHPFCRTHSSGDHGDQEPWSFGEPYTTVARKFISLRYQLLPYIYTTFWQYCQHGTPMLRSLAFLDQADPETHYREEEFGLGEAFFICPVSKPDCDGRWLYLPQGNWYDFWTNQQLEGREEVWRDTPLDRMPIFVKAGSIIPLGPHRQHTADREQAAPTIHVYNHDGQASGVWYEDAGDGNADSLISNFTWHVDKHLGRLTQKRHGAFQEPYATVNLAIHGVDGRLGKVVIDGVSREPSAAGRSWMVEGVPTDFHQMECHLAQ